MPFLFQALNSVLEGSWSLNLLPPQLLVTSCSLFYCYITHNNSLSSVPGLNLDSTVKVQESDRKRALTASQNDFLPVVWTAAAAWQFLAPPAEERHWSRLLIGVHFPSRWPPNVSFSATIRLDFLPDPDFGHDKVSFITNGLQSHFPLNIMLPRGWNFWLTWRLQEVSKSVKF